MDSTEGWRRLRLAIRQLQVNVEHAPHLIPGAVAEVREHFDALDVELSMLNNPPHAQRLVCGSNGELLYRDTDGHGRHANGHVCDYPDELPIGRCVDCGVDVDPTSTDPAVQGCYANRGFGHMRVVGR